MDGNYVSFGLGAGIFGWSAHQAGWQASILGWEARALEEAILFFQKWRSGDLVLGSVGAEVPRSFDFVVQGMSDRNRGSAD